MARILILGGPGSETAVLGRRVAPMIGVPLTELDQIGYEGGSGPKRPLAAKMAEVAELAARQQWVVEGMYLGWTEALLDRATDIVWLDVPWRVAAWRIVVRHARAGRRGPNQHHGSGNLWNLLKSARRYYRARAVVHAELDDDDQVTHAETKRALAGRKSKVIRCSSNKKIERFLDTVPKVV
jgi:adenylate kinase family enzyme